MLDKTQYSSWVSRMLLYIKGKESGKVLVDSLINKPFQYGTVTDTGTLTTSTIVRARRYDEHTDAKHIWDRVKLLIEDSKISLEERESKLYDEFDMFTSVPGETIHSYYLRFVQLINDMHTIGMTMKPIQVNTKFINHLQPEWSKFVTDEPFLNPLALVANTYNFSPSYTNQTQYHQELTPFAQKQVLPIASQQLNDVPMVQQRS
ncbi:hypothetical protein Tco_1216204 [Tanacetum coccineum]